MKGGTVTLIIAIVAGIVVIGAGSIVALTQKYDNVVDVNLQEIVSAFVKDVENTKTINAAKYEKLKSDINALGYEYEIEMELQILDENPGKKTSQTNYTKIGENVYYTVYLTQIEELIKDEKTIQLKPGDMIYLKVTLKNTLNQKASRSLFNFSNSDENSESADDSAMVK